MASRAAAGSEALVARAARDALERGNAVDAVVTGLLIAAADSPGVLLGPVQLLIGGAGAGLLAVDGRVRQPGLGIPRPRGVQAGKEVPAAARIGVPALPATLATVLASLGSIHLGRAAGPAVECARAHSAERASVLQAISRRGAAAMTDDGIANELLAVAGRAAGGTLTQDDLAAVRPALVASDEQSLGTRGVLRIPWREGAAETATTQVVLAADARGLTAVACYEVPVDGLPIPALGLLAAPAATAVMRGTARVPPGTPCGAPAPIALCSRRGVVDFAVGVAQAERAERSLDALLACLDDAPALLEAIRRSPGRPAALLRANASVTAVSSA